MMKNLTFHKLFFLIIYRIYLALLGFASHWPLQKNWQNAAAGSFQRFNDGAQFSNAIAFYMECKVHSGEFRRKNSTSVRQGNQSYICRNWVELQHKNSQDEQNNPACSIITFRIFQHQPFNFPLLGDAHFMPLSGVKTLWFRNDICV